MTTSDTTALAIAAVATLLGVAVVVSMWRRSRRRRRAVRSRHPSVRPPLRVGFVDVEPWSRLCIDVPPGAPEVAVDIVTYRRARPPGPWDDEPLDAPLVIAPGSRAVLAATLPSGSAADVVVAWTARHPSGPVQGSRLFRLPETREVQQFVPLRSGALAGRSVALLLALLVAAGAVIGSAAATRDGARADDQAAVPDAPPGAASRPTTPPRSTTATSAPPSTAPIAAASTTVATTSSTTVAPTTAAATAPTTTPVSSTPGTAPGTVPASGPRVTAEGRLGPCRFGDECLIVGFTIEGFAGSPQEYVCEFEDGSRFTFRFDSGGVDDACATGSAGAAITVEVDGVRSGTVTRDDVP